MSVCVAPPIGTWSTHAPTILIVEDAEDTLEVMTLVFEAVGYRVLSAESIVGALGLLRGGERIDVILSDYNLVDGSGVAMIRKAVVEGLLDLAITPALICTACENVEAPPNVPVLHKPIDPMVLLREVDQAVFGAEEREAVAAYAGRMRG